MVGVWNPGVDQVHTLLIKLGHPFDRLRGDRQPRRRERIAREVEPPTDPADEFFVRVLLDVQGSETRDVTGSETRT